jgi:hypothetical protein
MLESVVAALVTALVSVTSVIGYLKISNGPGNNPGNNVKSLDKEFTAQVQRCNERFMEIAEERGEVKSALKSIDTRLEHIESRLACPQGRAAEAAG